MFKQLTLVVLLTLLCKDLAAQNTGDPQGGAVRKEDGFKKYYFAACAIWDVNFDKVKAQETITRIAKLANKSVRDGKSDAVPAIVRATVDVLRCTVGESTASSASYSVIHAARSKHIGISNLQLIVFVVARELGLAVRPGTSQWGDALIESRSGRRIHYYVVARPTPSGGVPMLVRFGAPFSDTKNPLCAVSLTGRQWLAEILASHVDPKDEEKRGRQLQLANELAPKSPTVPLLAAFFLHVRGTHMQEARRLYLEAIRRGAKDPTVYLNLGAIELRRKGGRRDDAIRYLRLAMKAGDRSVTCHRLLARAFEEEGGNVAEAIKVVQKGLTEHSGDPDLLEQLGRYRMSDRDYVLAFRSFMQALRRSPTEERLYWSAVTILGETRKLKKDEVLRLCKWTLDAIEHKPNSVPLWRALARTQAWLGDGASAHFTLRNAAVLDPAHARTWYGKDSSAVTRMANADKKTR